MRTLKTFIRGIVVLATLLPLTACTVTYQFAPIEATVVDAETGAPIEGVVVIANWELVKGSFDGERYFGQLEVKETVTDKNGRFFFAGFTKDDSSGAELRQSDPQILIFKAGYEFQRFVNDYRDGGAGMGSSFRTAAVNGKTVKLVKQVADKSRIRQVHSDLVYSRLAFITKTMPHTNESEKCYWQSVPRMLAETRTQESLMRQMGIDPSSIYENLMANNDQYAAKAKVPCIAPRELFNGIRK